QGHAQAQNLRESGLNVIVSEVPGTPNAKLAEEHGFKVLSAADAAAKAQVVQMLVPDQVQAAVYRSAILENLKENDVLVFSHGFNIHYRQIEPPKFVDVIMIAPKGPGHLVRSEYVKGGGVPALIAVENDHSGKAKEIALAYARGIGSTRAGVLETTFKEETETDLFGEQVALCGGVADLIKGAFETLTAAGYQPEVAYFECMHEMKLIVDLFYQGGLSYMNYSVSETAEYGGLTRGKRIINQQSRDAMLDILYDIQTGAFAREWLCENVVNQPVLKRLRELDYNHPIEQVGRRLRKMMPFVNPKEI
ncbi:MAG: ketol-acid reductoisomerase, partial [Planctomycetes bacterium]|nr:ketol-acid reductoisomerase [Planctomycetota bacterium]